MSEHSKAIMRRVSDASLRRRGVIRAEIAMRVFGIYLERGGEASIAAINAVDAAESLIHALDSHAIADAAKLSAPPTNWMHDWEDRRGAITQSVEWAARDGELAFINGLGIGSNPYQAQELRDAWAGGWTDAQRKDKST